MPLATCRVLVVDDEHMIQRIFQRSLGGAGASVASAGTLAEARAALDAGEFDVVFTDLDLDGDDGLSVAEHAARLQPAAQVVILTGKPDLESAIRAVELGVSRYLKKPLALEEIRAVATDAARASKAARARITDAAFVAELRRTGAIAAEGLAGRLDAALATVHMVYQPIVDLDLHQAVAWEALVRTEAPGVSPPELFRMAEQLDRVGELTRTIRARVAEDLHAAPPDTTLFLNLHAAELAEGGILDPAGPLAPFASRIVVEITERSSLHQNTELATQIAAMRELGFRIALDDLGAGYAGLSSFATLCPNIAKVDRSLVSGADGDPLRRHIVHTIVRMCADLAIPVVAEGIETAEEYALMRDMGCALGQGYWFAYPRRGALGQPITPQAPFVMPS